MVNDVEYEIKSCKYKYSKQKKLRKEQKDSLCENYIKLT